MLFSLLFSVLASAAPAAAAPPPGVWTPDRGDGAYRNPVLQGDYSDPDAIRVGGDFYLTSSSFSNVPGLPVLHSRDLVNWTLIGHALPALEPLDHFTTVRPGEGVWAPAIRHHGGKFWIFYPDPDFGIYVVTAADPAGAWSAPVLVKGGKGLIDPCPLWDDDGRVYLVHGWAKSRSGKNNLLTLNELSADGLRVTDGEGAVIIDENTGRPMPDRNWEHGLHQLIELKEEVTPTHSHETLSRLSFQRFFRLYHHLGGMTGTVFDHNAFWGSLTGRPEDSHAVLADPKLAAPGGHKAADYAPRPGSPLLHAGLPVPDNGGRDFAGRSVNQAGSPNIGAL